MMQFCYDYLWAFFMGGAIGFVMFALGMILGKVGAMAPNSRREESIISMLQVGGLVLFIICWGGFLIGLFQNFLDFLATVTKTAS